MVAMPGRDGYSMAKRTTSERRPGSGVAGRSMPTRTVLDDQALALGTRIRERRRAKGLSLGRLAEITDLSHPFLSQVERGHARPSISSLQRIAEALDVDAGWLFGVGGAERDPVQVVRVENVQPLRYTEGQPEGAARAFQAAGWGTWFLDILELPAVFNGYSEGDHDVVAYVLEGTVEADVDGELHSLGPCDAIFVAGHRPRRFRSTSGDRAHMVVFVVDRPDRAVFGVDSPD